VLFFASPLIALLAVLWTSRDLAPEPVVEGLGGAGVPARRIDLGLGLAAMLVALAAALLGGWLAPLAQRAASPDPSAAWARSGGAPEWVREGWTWVRADGRLVRIAVAGDTVRATGTIEFGAGGAVRKAFGPGGGGAGVLPTADEARLLAAPPAFLTFPELVEASGVRAAFGHLSAPVNAELALRGAIAALALPAAGTGLACRRIRRARRRWSLVALLALAAMLGLQASHVWATRGELPVAMVVAVPLGLASMVALLAWGLAGRPYSQRQ
jgi:hypothetical protein